MKNVWDGEYVWGMNSEMCCGRWKCDGDGGNVMGTANGVETHGRASLHWASANI